MKVKGNVFKNKKEINFSTSVRVDRRGSRVEAHHYVSKWLVDLANFHVYYLLRLRAIQQSYQKTLEKFQIQRYAARHASSS
jgi:hypothetical protein